MMVFCWGCESMLRSVQRKILTAKRLSDTSVGMAFQSFLRNHYSDFQITYCNFLKINRAVVTCRTTCSPHTPLLFIGHFFALWVKLVSLELNVWSSKWEVYIILSVSYLTKKLMALDIGLILFNSLEIYFLTIC